MICQLTSPNVVDVAGLYRLCVIKGAHKDQNEYE